MAAMDDRQILIAKLRSLPDQLEALVQGLTPKQLTTLVASDSWTVAQHIHHIADSHMNSFIRVKLILTEERPLLKPYDQDRWVTLVDERGLPITTSLQILRGLHERWVALWESLEGTDWEREGVHLEVGLVKLADLLQSYAQHGEDHMRQIEAILAAQEGQRLSST
ncbi:MAG: DinB family protein [Herpetosiphonaceae bacterium]|nr:DinB family protein [Herpetosiphonaceae bacterium]